MTRKSAADDTDPSQRGKRTGWEVAAAVASPQIPEPGFVIPQTGNCWVCCSHPAQISSFLFQLPQVSIWREACGEAGVGSRVHHAHVTPRELKL